MQAWNRSFQAGLEPRLAIDPVNLGHQWRIEKRILGNVNPIAGGKQNMIHYPFAAIGKRHSRLVGSGQNRLYGNSCLYGYVLYPINQPSRTGRAYGAASDPILNVSWKQTEIIRSGCQLAHARRPNISGRL